MKDYIDLAARNGVILLDTGPCQFCGAVTKRGIHECLEVFNFGFQDIDYSKFENHIFRFLIVDAHTLQHPEVHGRWNNHFHLTRMHLILSYKVPWTYDLSPKLSTYLNQYKAQHADEYLHPPTAPNRGSITTTDLLAPAMTAEERKQMVRLWAEEVYSKWAMHHAVVDEVV